MTETERLAEELRRAREEIERLSKDVAESAGARAAFDAFLRLPPVAFTIYDREMRYLRVSPGWIARSGLSEAEVIGKSLYEVAPWAREFEALHQRCLAGGPCTAHQVAVPKPGGTLYQTIELAPWYTADGAVGGVAALSYEITDVMRAREAVRCSEQRLTLALEISQSVVWELSLKNQRFFATGAVAAMFDEVPTYKALTEDPLMMVHPEDRARVQAVWDEQTARQAPFRIEYRIARRDGAEIWVDAATEVLRDAEGAPERVIGVLKDITGRKHDQLAAARAREAAEAANLAKSEFLANMSHEIRTPLNGVLGVASVLARTPLTAQQQELVKLVESSAVTLERLLSDVLDLARIEAGGFEIKPEPFDLGELLRGVHALFQPRARDKGLAFELALGPGCEGSYVGDGVRLRQIVANLLSNAVKFTEAGFVRLTAEMDGAADGGPPRLIVVVEDSGIGFDPETAERLFERFQQADGSIPRRYGGSGLGLAISKALAEHMGGFLQAQSEPGQGSAFTLMTPLAPAVAAPKAVQPAAVAAPSDRSRPLRVLLAEDHPTNRKVVELILAAAKIAMVSVEDGAQALAAAKADRFDVILMDMQMPVMDGLTAIRKLRAHEAASGAPRTPVLALTANAMPEHVRASRQAGADGHVSKPVSATALLEAVMAASAGGAETVAA